MNEKHYKLRFLPLFEEDLNEIVDYITNRLKNPIAADALGAVTLVKGFSAVPHRGHSSVKAGLPVFINADQALRSATVSLAV